MNTFSKHITFKVLTCFMVMVLLMPTGLKFSHAFSHHQHEICNGESQTHLHKADVDCSFYKFNLSAAFILPAFSVEIMPSDENHQKYAEAYSFLSEFQQLHFSLRGPPQN